MKRDALIDLVRGQAMILVLFGHALQIFHIYDTPRFSEAAFEVWRVIYAFHMPAFFFVSGAAAWHAEQKSGRNAPIPHGLALILFALITHLVFLPFVIWGGETDQTWSVHNILGPFWSLTGFSIAVTWFLASLGLVRIIDAVFAKYKIWWKHLCILVVLAGAYVLAMRYHSTFFQAPSLVFGYLFFVIGKMVVTRKEWILSRCRGYAGLGVIVMAALLLGWGAFCNHGCMFNFAHHCDYFHQISFAVLMISGLFGYLPTFLAGAFGGIVLLVAVGWFLQKSRISQPIELIGRHSLPILIVNGLVIMIGNEKFKRLGFDFAGASFIVPVVLTYIQIVIGLRCAPVADALYKTLIGGVASAQNFIVRLRTSI